MSHLSRPIDLNTPSNLQAVAFATLMTIAYMIYELSAGNSIIESTVKGSFAGGSAFLAWALGREMDPDHNLTASFAALFTTTGILLWGLPSLFTIGLLLMNSRVLNQSVGLPPTLVDALAVLVVTGLTVIFTDYWLMGIVTGVVFLVDSFIPNCFHPLNRVFAAACFGTTPIIASIYRDFKVDSVALIVTLLVAFTYFTGIFFAYQQPLHSVGDRTGEPLDRRRIAATQITMGGTALALMLWHGNLGIIAAFPVWSAMLGFGIATTLGKLSQPVHHSSPLE